jgi:uncharacterized membrane protein YdjX (TVP38/TMEM64 family)
LDYNKGENKMEKIITAKTVIFWIIVAFISNIIGIVTGSLT